MANIVDIEGIGEVYAAKLTEYGIETIEGLLEAGKDKTGRQALAEKAGISETHILNWVNRADLARINGIGTQYADLLEHAGVDSVPELAQRNPENLHAKMEEVNAQKNLVNRVPSLSEVTNWIEQAQSLPRVVTH